jgi:RNA polymerase sigma-70 factor (ECF subfamily)
MTAVKKTTLPKEVSDLTEEQALRQMKQGSQDALAWFIQRYGAYVSTIIHNIIGQRMSNADVEEVASDVFLALWNNAGKILPNAARSWLATVARNTARSRLRRASDTLPLDEEAVIVDDRTPEATLERREQAVRVRMALLSLNPVDREVFLRFYYYYQKTADIAADMGLNESTVRTKLNRGRAKLRDFLLREDNHDETEKGGAAWNTISMI